MIDYGKFVFSCGLNLCFLLVSMVLVVNIVMYPQAPLYDRDTYAFNLPMAHSRVLQEFPLAEESCLAKLTYISFIEAASSHDWSMMDMKPGHLASVGTTLKGGLSSRASSRVH